MTNDVTDTRTSRRWLLRAKATQGVGQRDSQQKLSLLGQRCGQWTSDEKQSELASQHLKEATHPIGGCVNCYALADEARADRTAATYA